MAAPDKTPLPQVAILLATYCGETFLPEQLASIAAQRGVDWRLSWRDDGSTDRTIAVTEAFAASQPAGRVQRCTEPSGRLGAARSFLRLLAAAPDDVAFFAFCDQDDVWLPDKLARAATALASIPAAHPAFYCARQELVGPGLEPLGLSPPLRRPPGFANALVQNIATGCTMVLNAAARRLILDGPEPPDGTLHDWWCYLLVTGAGGTVIRDEQPALLYRQHGTNAVGAADSAWVRLRSALQRGSGSYLRRIVIQAEALEKATALTADARAGLRAIRHLRDPNPLRRILALRQGGFHRQGVLEDLLLLAWVAGQPAKMNE